MLPSTFESKVQPQYLRIPRGKRRQRGFDFVVEEAVHGLFLGIGHLVGDETLDQRAIAFRIHRRIETHVAGVESGERLHDIDRQAGELRQLLGGRLATHLLAENLRRLDDAREIRRAIERHADGAALTRQRRKNRLANPPYCVRDELDALIGIKLSRSREQTDVALANEIDERHAAVLIFLCYGDHEAQVALYELLESVRVTGTNPTGNLDLLGTFEQRKSADLI